MSNPSDEVRPNEVRPNEVRPNGVGQGRRGMPRYAEVGQGTPRYAKVGKDGVDVGLTLLTWAMTLISGAAFGYAYYLLIS